MSAGERSTSSHSSSVECPICGEKNGDLWEYEEGCHEIECGHCEAPLTLDIEFSVTYKLTAKEK